MIEVAELRVGMQVWHASRIEKSHVYLIGICGTDLR